MYVCVGCRPAKTGSARKSFSRLILRHQYFATTQFAPPGSMKLLFTSLDPKDNCLYVINEINDRIAPSCVDWGRVRCRGVVE